MLEIDQNRPLLVRIMRGPAALIRPFIWAFLKGHDEQDIICCDTQIRNRAVKDAPNRQAFRCYFAVQTIDV